RLVPQVPRDLELLCLKCLNKEPAQRFATAGALADELRRFQEGRPIKTRPAPLWEQAWKWARRQPAAAALVAASVLALLTLVLFLDQRARIAQRELADQQRIDKRRGNALELHLKAQHALDQGKPATARTELDKAFGIVHAEPDLADLQQSLDALQRVLRAR